MLNLFSGNFEIVNYPVLVREGINVNRRGILLLLFYWWSIWSLFFHPGT